MAGRERPDEADAVTLRATRAADWDMIRAWLRLPAVAAWWGEATATEAEVRIVLETPSAFARVVEAGGTPIGYVHAIDAQHWGASLPDGMPPGTYDLDVFIAAPGWRGRGAGRRAVELMADEIFSTTLAPAVSVYAPLDNEAAIRAYERAGFRWIRVTPDPRHGPSWLMLRERPRR